MTDLQKLLADATPGPWVIGPRVTKKNGAAYERICGGGWISFARVWVRMEGKGCDTPRGLANARLIAMAPELAAALVAASKALHFYADSHTPPNGGPWGVGSTDFGAVATKALQDINSLTGAK